MRDPQGFVQFEGDTVVRHLHEPLAPGHFLHSSLARRWVSEGRLVGYEFDRPQRILSSRLAFVTQPSEWCDAQLHAAAALTLQLQKEANAEGFDLKDASAWNVIFDGTRPVFCDLLSFEPLRSRQWWAAGQFTRHFLLPLLLSRRVGMASHECFRLWRDGVAPATAARLLGWRRFLGRYFLLMLPASTSSSPAAGANVSEPANGDILDFRSRLAESLGWFLRGLDPSASREPGSTWLGYVDKRDHYSPDSLTAKTDAVLKALDIVRPAWVADLGCNTGEFSSLCLERGASVVSLDADFRCVQQLFDRHANTRLHTVVASLDDLPPARGWGAGEYPSLDQRMRGRFDLVLMLAVIHHLLVSAAIRADQVAQWLHGCTRDWLLVEYVDSADSQMQLLCRQRRRDPGEFSMAMQRDAFARAGFATVRETVLSTSRVLALLRKQA